MEHPIAWDRRRQSGRERRKQKLRVWAQYFKKTNGHIIVSTWGEPLWVEWWLLSCRTRCLFYPFYLSSFSGTWLLRMKLQLRPTALLKRRGKDGSSCHICCRTGHIFTARCSEGLSNNMSGFFFSIFTHPIWEGRTQGLKLLWLVIPVRVIEARCIGSDPLSSVWAVGENGRRGSSRRNKSSLLLFTAVNLTSLSS